MNNVSFSQQVKEAIVMTQYWVQTYLNSYFQQALEHPFDAANTFARLLGPIATLIGSGILWLNYTNERSKRVQEKEKNDNEVKLAESRLISERFSKAIEQLGNGNIHIRLGGIYSLEKIAKDTPDEHWRIMEVLTAFIRECSPSKRTQKPQKNDENEKIAGVTADIQAALTVLNRRDEANDQGRVLDLQRTNLSNADLREANLHNANLTMANLSFADLTGANLTGAQLVQANLKNAHLNHADLSEALLVMSDMNHANLSKTNMKEAFLIRASLKGAFLIEADLHNANLTMADLSEANLSGAQLQGVALSDTALSSANLIMEKLRKSQSKESQITIKEIQAGRLIVGTVMPNGKGYNENISITEQCVLPTLS